MTDDGLQTAQSAMGRDERGRFVRGCPPGPGNPLAQRVARLRAALLSAVGAEDIRAVVQALLQQAKGGDVGAAKVLLSWCLGKPVELDLLTRLEELEKAVYGEEATE